MPCRILYLIGELHTGGAERQLCYLLRAMDRERYQPAVAVWNYRDEDFHVPQVQALGVPLHSFPQRASSLEKLTAFRRLVRQVQPEVIHSYSFYTNFAVQWATQGLKAIPMGSIRSDFAWAKRQCGPMLGRLSARWPSNQICNSMATVRRARSVRTCFVPARLSVVRNGIDLEQFRSIPVPTTQPIRILGIGYLLPVKRWDYLLVAAQKLKHLGLHFLVQIAGNGPLQSVLTKHAVNLGVSDCVHFVGHVADVHSLIAEAAAVVHTADSEGCPNSVMEAMACGRAVVATDAGDIISLVENGRTGFVVPHNDIAMLVECIRRLMTDIDLRRRMGAAGRKKAEGEFGLDRLVSETLAVYRSAGWREA
jgi:glycosyltransferase involved in cell wall biosynthesis